MRVEIFDYRCYRIEERGVERRKRRGWGDTNVYISNHLMHLKEEAGKLNCHIRTSTGLQSGHH